MIDSHDKEGLPERNFGPNPADFPVGSVESRAAARALLTRRDITCVVIMTGLPWPYQEPVTIDLPDTVAYYRAPDDSVVEVVRREYERGKFTAFIDQTWNDGSVYQGDHRVNSFADLRKLCRIASPTSGMVRSEIATSGKQHDS